MRWNVQIRVSTRDNIPTSPQASKLHSRVDKWDKKVRLAGRAKGCVQSARGGYTAEEGTGTVTLVPSRQTSLR